MSHDPLELATRALREQPVSHEGADATKRALLEAARSKVAVPASKRAAPAWLLPLVAALAAGGALAGAGRQLASPGNVLEPTVRSEAVPSAEASARNLPGPTMTAPRAEDASPLPMGSEQSDGGGRADATPPPSPDPAPTPPHVASAGGPVSKGVSAGGAAQLDDTRRVRRPAPVTSAPPPDPTDELYREAHDLHFHGGSPQAAVAAWDRYLAAAPKGRFVVEARFNRALALLRAGRREEGLSALAPFAEGRFGGYRKDEARRLLEAAAGR